jgi:hypothetical protein
VIDGVHDREGERKREEITLLRVIHMINKYMSCPEEGSNRPFIL